MSESDNKTPVTDGGVPPQGTTSQNRDPEYTLCCGGTEDDQHMVEMEFEPDAATPHWVCPDCGSKSWVAEEQVIEL